MTLPEQLRAIADRIEAAEAERRAAIAQLTEFAAGAYDVIDELGVALDADVAEVMRDGSSIDSAVLVAAERVPSEGPSSPSAPSGSADAGVVATATTPARHAGDAGSTPATRSTPPPKPSSPAGIMRPCPVCGREFDTSQGVSLHRRKAHDNGGPPTILRKGIETPIEETTERRWPARPTIAERVAARDASRSAAATRRQGRHVGGGA